MAKLKNICISVFFLLLLFSSFACASAKSWTVMVYLAADNNLERDAVDDFLEMAQAGSDENINILVQLDRRSGYDTRYGDWRICHRFYVAPGMEPYEDNGIADWGDGQGGGREVNMGHPDTLKDFITWGEENYPAERYAVILWNHGGGWKALEEEGKLPLPFKEVCWDDTAGDVLTMKQVRQALEDAGCHMDIIGFDACLMSMLEVAAEIKDLGSVMVASEETEPLSGWNFAGFLSDLKEDPSMLPSQLGASIVDAYADYGEGETLSAVDLAQIRDFIGVLDALLEEIISGGSEWFNVYLARQEAQGFSEPEFIDIYSFLYRLSLADVSLYLQWLLDDAMEIFQTLVIANYSVSGYDAFGLSVYFPAHGGKIDADYNSSVILFAGESLWKDFLEEFISADLFSGYTSIFSEDFSEGLPAGWTVVDGYGGGHTWEVKYSQPAYPSSYLEPPFMIADSDAAGQEEYMDTHLVTPSFDFSGYASVYLKFNHFFKWYSWGDDEKGDVDIKVGEGAWQNLKRYRGSNAEGSVFVDITGIVAGQGNVKIRWRYYDANYDWFWAVDDVEFWTYNPEPLGPGDINSDGRIDISDVILCLRMSVGLDIDTGGSIYSFPYEELAGLADVNEDGLINIQDVILILRASLELD